MRDALPREALAPILEREVRARDTQKADGTWEGGVGACARQIAATGAMTEDAAARRIHAIRTGNGYIGPGEVDFLTADNLLTGLDRQDAWLDELAPYVEEPGRAYDPEHEKDHTCGECGRWIDFEGKSIAGVRLPEGSLCYRCAAVGLPDPIPRPNATGQVRRKIPWEDVRRLYIDYVEKPYTIEQLIAPHLERYGLASPESGAVSLTHSWRALGLPMRTRHESKKHLSKLRGPSRHRRLPEADLRKMHALHVRHDVSQNQICRATHAKYGFRTHKDMIGPLSRSWRALGLKARDRIEMTRIKSTTNGLSPRNWKERQRRRREAGWGTGNGAGLTVKGKPLNPACLECSRPAVDGELYCFTHHPDNREGIVEHVNAMRKLSPRHKPENLVPIGELPASIRAWFEWNGRRWAPLIAATGWQNTSLGRFARMPPEQIVLRETYARLAGALEEVSRASA